MKLLLVPWSVLAMVERWTERKFRINSPYLAQRGVRGDGEYKQGVLAAYKESQSLHNTAQIFEVQKKPSTLKCD